MPITKFENTTIEKKTLVVEECVFLNCILRECHLFYSGGAFDWANTAFENCNWTFREEARNTIQLLQVIGLIKGQMTPGTVPVTKPQGSGTLH